MKNTNEIYYNKNKCLIAGEVLIDWSAKAGCTTVVQMVFKKLGILKMALDYHPTGWVHDFRDERYYNMYKHKDDSLYFKDPNIKKIKFVRNPYNRAVSSYIHLNRTKLRDLVPEKNLTFEEFLTLMKHKRIVDNPHWGYQCRQGEINSYNNGKSFYDRVVKIEQFPEVLDSLSDIIKLEPVKYDTHHVVYETEQTGYAGNVNWDKIRNNLPSPGAFYNEYTIDLVKEVYKYDLMLYKYEHVD